MDKQERKIKNVWTFGIAFTSACRMYRRETTAEVLGLISRIYDQFLPYLDDVSILCAARDFQPIIMGIPQDTLPMPNEQEKPFGVFRERVMAECMNRERELSQPIWKIGETMQCVSSYASPRGHFPNTEQFEAWAEKHIAKATGCHAESKDLIPLPEDFLEDFNLLCLWMVRYSVGRHTHMPDTAAEFVMDNIEHISNDTAQKILDAVAGQENDGWIRMRDALKANSV